MLEEQLTSKPRRTPMTAAAIARYRYIGVTDDCVECQRCGKADLKSTIVLAILDAEGNDSEVTYYGSSCAARALGRTGRGQAAKILTEAQAAQRQLAQRVAFARELLAFYQVDGSSTPAEISRAAGRYAETHRNATWAAGMSSDVWVQHVKDMIARRTADIREGELVGL
jgi:hypothetical protein